MQNPSILVVRLGAMGDVLHALPAVASLKQSFPHSRITWALRPRWTPLLEGNPFVDDILLLDRRNLQTVRAAWSRLRANRFDFAVDFQGLIQSALIAAAAARADQIYGFHSSQVRERPASLFYSQKVQTASSHVVDQNIELAAAAGATNLLHSFPIPSGKPEGELPEGRFVLASPLAGWGSKQWPIQNYEELAHVIYDRFGWPLVLNGPPQAESILRSVRGVKVHLSGIAGLIDATRRAHAVIGVDSGPLHLAAALAKPGVALFGPTDPARNGPYGNSMQVLRSAGAVTSYKRLQQTDSSLAAIPATAVVEALEASLTLDAAE